MNVRALISDFRVYLQPQPVRMFLLGFSSGLPLLLILGTLSFWLREAGVDLKTIGFFSWIGLVYGFKWVWAPAVDRLRIPRARAPARAPSLLAPAVPGGRHCGAGGHGGVGSPASPAGHHGLCAHVRVLFGDTGHCARRLPHRVRGLESAGRARRHVPDGLSAGHDLGGRRHARAGGPGAQAGRRATFRMPGSSPISAWRRPCAWAC